MRTTAAIHKPSKSEQPGMLAEWMMFRALLGAIALMALGGCGTVQVASAVYDPTGGVSYGGTLDATWPVAGWSGDARLLDPHFYMDEEDAPRWLLMMTPQTNR